MRGVHVWLYRASIAAAVWSFFLGAGALGHWLTRGEHLALPTPLTALALMFAAASIVCSAPEGRPLRGRVAGRAAGAIVFLIGLFAMISRISGHPLRFETLGTGTLALPPASFTSTSVAAALMLIGAALVTFDWKTKDGAYPSVAFSVGASFVALVGVTAHAYGASVVPSLTRHPVVGMRLWSSIALAVLSLAPLTLRPERGLMRIVLSESLAGRVARRQLLLALATPAVLGLLIALLMKLGLDNVHMALATLAVAVLPITYSLAVKSALALDRAERAAHLAEEHRLAAEKKNSMWLQHVLDEMPEAVLITDLEGNVTSMNHRARDLLGDDAGAWKSQPFAHAVSKLDHAHNEEVTLRDRRGREVPVLASAAPVMDAGVAGTVIVLRDICLLKELEHLREQWTSVVAHDLRQPLALISLGAQTLQRRESKALSPYGVRSVEMIREASARLDRMIGDLLDASRIEAHQLTVLPEVVELEPLVREVVERAASVHRADIHIDVRSRLPRLFCDPARLEQVLGNLLSNAVKYGVAGTPVRVALESGGDSVAISVTNQGAGLERHELAQLFNRYGRGTAGRASREGIGLGLYITKGLVEAHGGRIEVESVPGVETTFRVILPALRDTADVTDVTETLERVSRPRGRESLPSRPSA